MNDIDEGLSNSSDTGLIDSVFFSARLLHFVMEFSNVWTEKMTERGEQLLNVVLRLAMMFGEGRFTDTVAFPLLLDTVFYILDGS